MYWDIVKAHPIGQRTLELEFADGLQGRVQIPTSFCNGVFTPLLCDDLLKQVRIEHGALTWPGGLDLAPDTMHKQICSSPARLYVVGERT